MLGIRRREFITILGGAAAWPLAAHSQRADRIGRVGVLIPAFTASDREGQARIAAFLDTLGKLGWSDGRNLQIEYRWRAPDADRDKPQAAEVLRSMPDVIVASANPAVAELQKLTSTVPIVFTQVSEPVGGGFVASLARPGGNITGFQNFETAIGGKWLAVLKEATPYMNRAAV